MWQQSGLFCTERHLLECILLALILSLRFVEKKLLAINFSLIKLTKSLTDRPFHSFIGDDRSSLHISANGFVRGHHISYDRVQLVGLQDRVVLLHYILHVLVLCVPWDAHGRSEFESSSCFHIGICSLHRPKPFLWLPYAGTGKPLQTNRDISEF